MSERLSWYECDSCGTHPGYWNSTVPCPHCGGFVGFYCRVPEAILDPFLDAATERGRELERKDREEHLVAVVEKVKRDCSTVPCPECLRRMDVSEGGSPIPAGFPSADCSTCPGTGRIPREKYAALGIARSARSSAALEVHHIAKRALTDFADWIESRNWEAKP